MSLYHHGDLRAALLRLAAEQIEIDGYERLELLGLGAKAGVSRGAPYRHFENRDALLIALGIEGFIELERNNNARTVGAGSAEDLLFDTCKAFLAFASARPQLFRLMFVSDFARRLSDAAAWFSAAERSFLSCERILARTLTNTGAKEIRAATVSCWSALTGFAILKLVGRVDLLLIDGETEDTLVDKVIAGQIKHLKPDEEKAKPQWFQKAAQASKIES